MKAMHAICHYQNGTLDHLHGAGEPGLYKSGIWKLDATEASALKGGWLYLHETSKQPAYFKARIEAIEGPDSEGKYWLTVRKQLFKGDVKWRGTKPTPSSYVRVVPATLQHELESAKGSHS